MPRRIYPFKREVKKGGKTIPLIFIIEKEGCDRYPIRRTQPKPEKRPEPVPA